MISVNVHCHQDRYATSKNVVTLKSRSGVSTYVMISGNVHIYAWPREAYVSAEVIVCVCTVSAA